MNPGRRTSAATSLAHRSRSYCRRRYSRAQQPQHVSITACTNRPTRPRRWIWETQGRLLIGISPAGATRTSLETSDGYAAVKAAAMAPPSEVPTSTIGSTACEETLDLILGFVVP